MRKNSTKNQRLNAEVMRALSGIIRNDVKDPRIPVMTSVTDVYVAPDLKTAKAYISIMGSDEEREGALLALRKAEGFIRTKLAKELNLRNTPTLVFAEDDSIAYGVSMYHKIEELTESTDSTEGDD